MADMSSIAGFLQCRMHLQNFQTFITRVTSRRAAVWLGWWLGLCALLLQAPAFAQDHIVERAWLDDPSGQWTLKDAQAQTMQKFTGMLSRGFGDSVTWVRLRVDPQAAPAPLREPDRLILRIRPVYLDEIQVFDPLAAPGQVTVIGDQHHPRLDELEGLDFLIPISRGTAPRDIWLRMTSTSTRKMNVQALNVDDLNRINRKQQLLFAGYLGLILIFAAWATIYWAFNRDHVVGAFALSMLAAFAYAIGALGYLRVFWPLEWPPWELNHFTTVFSILAVSSGVLFHTLFLAEFNPTRWAARSQATAGSFLATKLVLLMLGLPMAALRMNMMEVLLAPVFFLLSACMATGWSNPNAKIRPPLSRSLIIGFYALLLVLMAAAALPGLALAAGGEIGLYVVQAHGLVTGFLILVMLQYRMHVMTRQQHTTLLALERSQMQALQAQEIHEEQGKLLAMLTHELKTPLATMHMRLDANASGSREIKRAIREMNGVIDRCLQTAQLSDQQLVANRQSCHLASLITDAVNASWQPARMQTHFSPLPAIQTDSQLLFIVLSNLLENACKYAAPDSVIDVRLQALAAQDTEPARVRITVSNEPGVADWPDATRVFEKYYRSPHARRQAGTGLGLYLVYNIMQTLGGQIRYEPDDTRIRFVLELPMDLG
jgi:two-component system, sensor histidine kinase LadS